MLEPAEMSKTKDFFLKMQNGRILSGSLLSSLKNPINYGANFCAKASGYLSSFWQVCVSQ